MEEAIAKVEEKESLQSEEVDNFMVIMIKFAIIIIINIIIKIIIRQSEDVGGCTPRYIGHDIDSEMASNLRMLCLVVLLLRLVRVPGRFYENDKTEQPQHALSCRSSAEVCESHCMQACELVRCNL